MEIQQFFMQLKGRQPTEDELNSSCTESNIWSANMASWSTEKPTRGAAKAAETRRAKRAAKEHAESTPTQLQRQPVKVVRKIFFFFFCSVCGGRYEEVTDDVEDWIGCDGCETWLHWVCAGIIEEPESFL